LNKSQRLRRELVEELVQLALKRGITSHALRPQVMDISTGLNTETGRAEKISGAGMTAQMGFLLGCYGERHMRHLIGEVLGSELDGFVHGYSSDPFEVEADIGRENVNENGDVI
jgi:hypothetical protein